MGKSQDADMSWFNLLSGPFRSKPDTSDIEASHKKNDDDRGFDDSDDNGPRLKLYPGQMRQAFQINDSDLFGAVSDDDLYDRYKYTLYSEFEKSFRDGLSPFRGENHTFKLCDDTYMVWRHLHEEFFPFAKTIDRCPNKNPFIYHPSESSDSDSGSDYSMCFGYESHPDEDAFMRNRVKEQIVFKSLLPEPDTTAAASKAILSSPSVLTQSETGNAVVVNMEEYNPNSPRPTPPTMFVVYTKLDSDFWGACKATLKHSVLGVETKDMKSPFVSIERVPSFLVDFLCVLSDTGQRELVTEANDTWLVAPFWAVFLFEQCCRYNKALLDK